jgi:hypothetical protein
MAIVDTTNRMADHPLPDFGQDPSPAHFADGVGPPTGSCIGAQIPLAWSPYFLAQPYPNRRVPENFDTRVPTLGNRRSPRAAPSRAASTRSRKGANWGWTGTKRRGSCSVAPYGCRSSR